jgi:hypothetical protein
MFVATMLVRGWQRSPRWTTIYAGMLSIITALGLSYIYMDYIEPVISVGGENPLAQRADFSLFAWNAFLQSPLGLGLGALRNITTGVDLGYHVFDSVTDAFLLILLAEVGIVGFLVFALSLRELAWGKNVPSKALFLGLTIQMVGTDIPDFGPPYFAAMALIILIGRRNEAPAVRPVKSSRSAGA